MAPDTTPIWAILRTSYAGPPDGGGTTVTSQSQRGRDTVATCSSQPSELEAEVEEELSEGVISLFPFRGDVTNKQASFPFL